ncbi:MAG: GatB/YqeY domain-containing protein [Gammaproteobacteria bacterium]|nr:GatB/YqeY domain-containing protein [Gammaproteobacteria bacterium]
MTLKARIREDMIAAMKSGDKDRLKVIRLVMAAVKQIEVDKRIELDDAATLTVLNKMVKQRHDSVTQFREGGREDLAKIEIEEIAVLETYLPEQLSAAELDALIDQAIADTGADSMRDMGKVMGFIKQKAEGRADIGAASTKVKARLA